MVKPLLSMITAISGASSLASAALLLEDTINSANFLDSFDFFTGNDPTHGYVNYVSYDEAKDLVSTDNVIRMAADSTDATPGQPRRSVRVTSKKAYTNGLIVADIEHMPVGVGAWSAFWSFGPGWPNSGEIDVLEGVHLAAENTVTFHTSPGCVVNDNGSDPSSSIKTPDCNADNAYEGCGFNTKTPFGHGFNQMKGGVFATHWTSEFIAIYFFPRDNIPQDIKDDKPDPGSWGVPVVKFNGGYNCDISKHFKEHNLIFNITFCGDWAGGVWGQDPSSSEFSNAGISCEDFVSTRPEEFKEAYWIIHYVKTYKDGAPAAKREVSFTT